MLAVRTDQECCSGLFRESTARGGSGAARVDTAPRRPEVDVPMAQRSALRLRRPEAPLEHALCVGIQRLLQQLAHRRRDRLVQHSDAVLRDAIEDLLDAFGLESADSPLLRAQGKRLHARCAPRVRCSRVSAATAHGSYYY